jgi:hypothetical protein
MHVAPATIVHTKTQAVRIIGLRKIVEKEIDRSNATVPGDDKIGSRVSSKLDMLLDIVFSVSDRRPGATRPWLIL